ncbi:hypothetical protein D3C73_1102050 [compost metagenome]
MNSKPVLPNEPVLILTLLKPDDKANGLSKIWLKVFIEYAVKSMFNLFLKNPNEIPPS